MNRIKGPPGLREEGVDMDAGIKIGHDYDRQKPLICKVRFVDGSISFLVSSFASPSYTNSIC
jgi:hypothetical protein